MRKNILMSSDEPTDLELHELMVGVIEKVKSRAAVSKKKMDEKIQEELLKAQIKLKAMRQ